MSITLLNCVVVFHSIFSIWHGPPLSYLHERNLENRKKLALVRITNSAGMDTMNIVNNVGIFNDSAAMNSVFREWCRDEHCIMWIVLEWIMIHVNSVGSKTPPKLPSVSLIIWVVIEYSYFVWRPHRIYLTYSKIMKAIHVPEWMLWEFVFD